MKSLYHCVAGLDVHRMLYVLTVLVEQADGTVAKHQRSFSGFKRDLRDLVSWLLELGVERLVMESTAIYWKSVYAALEEAGIPAHVVNARHVKNVPGRKTDISDSEWLAQLGRFGPTELHPAQGPAGVAPGIALPPETGPNPGG